MKELSRRVYRDMLNEEFIAWNADATRRGAWLFPATLEKTGMRKDNIRCSRCDRDSTEVPRDDNEVPWFVAVKAPGDEWDPDAGSCLGEPTLLCSDCLVDHAIETDMTLTNEGVAKWAEQHVLKKLEALGRVFSANHGVTHNMTPGEWVKSLGEVW